jgi:hypothetical protein
MKTSLKNIQDKKPIKTSKVCQVPKQNSVFSYSLKKTRATVVLSQKETGFGYTMKMELLDDTLRLTQFTLTRNMKLANLSSELYDAASLEIFVQTLTFLFARADQHEAEEILFMLSQEDADQLMEFTGFFDKTESISTREGQKTLFSVYNTLETRKFLKERQGTIKTKIKHELWQMQREDRYIKHFLQNHQHGTLLPFLTLQDEDEKVKEYKDNVIPFPQRKRR